jgi:hypothetical protein
MTERGLNYYDHALRRKVFVPFDCAQCGNAPAIWKCGLCDDCFAAHLRAHGETVDPKDGER